MSPPVAYLVERLNAKPSGRGWMAECPAHDDRDPSLSISEGPDGRALINCHAGCDTNDVIAALGMAWRDLFPTAYHQPSGNGAAASRPTSPLDWEACVSALEPRELVRLGNDRWYSRAFCFWLHEKKLVGLYDGCFAFPVHDEAGNLVAVHYKTSKGWRYYPHGAKAHPLVIGELLPGNTVHVFESQWDAFALMDKSSERNGVIITRGANNSGPAAAAIPKDAKVYLWPQNDVAGEKWQKDICANSKATVKRARIPASCKDLNEWTKTGATSEDLLQAMKQAEIVREAEKSWDDALAESEVTATELNNLDLMPRKRLLGDWFAEGDCRFIFAFRGVGKTWLALAIAQALATGGKLGDWNAHEPAKVLYVDSEMPADLMRQRCDGLGGGCGRICDSSTTISCLSALGKSSTSQIWKFKTRSPDAALKLASKSCSSIISQLPLSE